MRNLRRPHNERVSKRENKEDGRYCTVDQIGILEIAAEEALARWQDAADADKLPEDHPTVWQLICDVKYPQEGRRTMTMLDATLKHCQYCYALFTGPGDSCPGCARREVETRTAAWLVTCIEATLAGMSDGPTKRNLSGALADARERGIL